MSSTNASDPNVFVDPVVNVRGTYWTWRLMFRDGFKVDNPGQLLSGPGEAREEASRFVDDNRERLRHEFLKRKHESKLAEDKK